MRARKCVVCFERPIATENLYCLPCSSAQWRLKSQGVAETIEGAAKRAREYERKRAKRKAVAK